MDPIKSMLKAPGTKRLKLEYDYLLSSSAFKCNLRRYNKAVAPKLELPGRRRHLLNVYARLEALVPDNLAANWFQAGAYTRPLFSTT